MGARPHTDKISADEPIEPGVKIIAGRRYLTIDRLAQLIDRTPRTLQRWHERRLGPPRIEILGLILYEETKLPVWLASHTKEPVRQPRPRKSPPAAVTAVPRDTDPPPLVCRGRRE